MNLFFQKLDDHMKMISSLLGVNLQQMPQPSHLEKVFG